MSGEMNTAVSGLNSVTKQMEMVGLNIANAGAVGYKATEAHFVTQVTGSAPPGGFSPGGVGTVAYNLIDQSGIVQGTRSLTDLAVRGAGMMVVGSQGSLAAGASNEYSFTRAGNFRPDKDGNLRNAAGFYLQGFRTNDQGVPTVANTSLLSSLETINVGSVANIITSTTTMELDLKLPASAAAGATETTYNRVYDSLGISHDLTFTWTKIGNNPLQWDLAITCPDAAAITKNTAGGNAYSGATSMNIVFNGSGQPQSFDGGTAPPSIYVDWNVASTAASDSTIALDLGTINTNEGLTTSAGAYELYNRTQDGRETGKLTGVMVDPKGILYYTYSNGEILARYKIPLADFSAANQLSPRTGNVFMQTDQSGLYNLLSAEEGGLGHFASSALELSNVDITEQFTKMIEAEHRYSANTKVISTSKEMFKDLKNI